MQSLSFSSLKRTVLTDLYAAAHGWTDTRARMELRVEVTAEDAMDVVALMKESLYQRYEDELNSLDLRTEGPRSAAASTGGGARQIQGFVNQLHRLAQAKQSRTFSLQEMQELANALQLQVGNFADFVDRLNQQCYLLKKAPRLYELA
jgi:DNA helicase MCM8